MRIFFDLDGTLLDCHQRLYQLYANLLSNDCLDFKKYWELKRKTYNHAYILKKIHHFSNEQVFYFQEKWLSLVEERQYLHLDRPFDWVDDLLEKLSHRHELYIVTARQSKSNTIEQLSQYKWLKFVSHVFITEHRASKDELINSIINPIGHGIFIGDSGEDVVSGKKLGLQTIAVLSGVRDRATLEKYSPDYILDNASSILQLLHYEPYY